LDALMSRGFDVSFEPGGVIDKFLPTVHGEFTVELADGEHTETDRVSWRARQSTRVTGGFTPDETGPWELGVRAVGPVTVRLDGATVVEIAGARRGGSYYGLGSPEVRRVVELEGGRRYELEVEYPAVPDEPFRGFTVGARPVSSRDLVVERAVAAAADADVAVVIVGTDDDWETEGEDRTTMALPGDQDALVTAVVAANPNTIVVVNAGSPVMMPWLDAVPAVLQIWFPGQTIGDALADVLTGVEEPGGRLPLTFPVRLEDTPAFAHHPGRDGRAVYAEGTFIGHRWYDREGIAPLFPFGHGLGYTTFSFGEARVEGTIDDGVTVSVDVTNTGGRAGSEVVQVYVEPPPGDPARPLRHLAAFRRVDLDAGASVTVTVELDRRSFSAWLNSQWTVPPGEYTIHVGRSSRDLEAVGTVR
jgi:beta-glucosidase